MVAKKSEPRSTNEEKSGSSVFVLFSPAGKAREELITGRRDAFLGEESGDSLAFERYSLALKDSLETCEETLSRVIE